MHSSLVHDVNVDEESPTSSKSDPDTDCDILGEGRSPAHAVSDEDRNAPPSTRGSLGPWIGPGERRRRKLPEIPKNRKCKYIHNIFFILDTFGIDFVSCDIRTWHHQS